jgi:GTP-binding protein Era
VAQRVFGSGVPVVIALNKVDLLSPAAIAVAIGQAAELGDFQALHPISALRDDGVDALRSELFALLPEGPPFFGEGEETDQPLTLRIAELVRERALALTREEVPHAVAVAVDEIVAPKRKHSGRVAATIAVETASQQRILVGKGGSMIRAVGEGARPEIEALLGGQIFLDLRVKVRPHWRRDDALLDRFGG